LYCDILGCEISQISSGATYEYSKTEKTLNRYLYAHGYAYIAKYLFRFQSL